MRIFYTNVHSICHICVSFLLMMSNFDIQQGDIVFEIQYIKVSKLILSYQKMKITVIFQVLTVMDSKDFLLSPNTFPMFRYFTWRRIEQPISDRHFHYLSTLSRNIGNGFGLRKPCPFNKYSPRLFCVKLEFESLNQLFYPPKQLIYPAQNIARRHIVKHVDKCFILMKDH